MNVTIQTSSAPNWVKCYHLQYVLQIFALLSGLSWKKQFGFEMHVHNREESCLFNVNKLAISEHLYKLCGPGQD